jgi:hypothetical protein
MRGWMIAEIDVLFGKMKEALIQIMNKGLGLLLYISL